MTTRPSLSSNLHRHCMYDSKNSITETMIEGAIKWATPLFQIPDFKDKQREVVHASVKRDCLAVLPTGYGKSLTYWVQPLILCAIDNPSIMETKINKGSLPTGYYNLVFSPLTAKLQDDIDKMRSFGFKVVHLLPSTSQAVIDKICRGEVHFVICCPESFFTDKGTVPDSIKPLLSSPSLGMIVIDEAHCLIKWGHDFRPHYLYLRKILMLAPAGTRMLCLTATLTRVDQLHLIELLHFNPTIIQASPYRPNLFFRLVPVSDVGKTDQVILSAIFREVLDSIEDDAKSVGTTVVFCRSYASVIRVYEWLEEELTRRGALYFPREKHTAEYRVLGQYHGVTDERVKLEVLARIGKSIKLLVCTSAFGMGCDFIIRRTIHIGIPTSISDLVQQTGRAGRDGLLAFCIIYWTLRNLGKGKNGMRADRWIQALLGVGDTTTPVSKLSASAASNPMASTPTPSASYAASSLSASSPESSPSPSSPARTPITSSARPTPSAFSAAISPSASSAASSPSVSSDHMTLPLPLPTSTGSNSRISVGVVNPCIQELMMKAYITANNALQGTCACCHNCKLTCGCSECTSVPSTEPEPSSHPVSSQEYSISKLQNLFAHHVPMIGEILASNAIHGGLPLPPICTTSDLISHGLTRKLAITILPSLPDCVDTKLHHPINSSNDQPNARSDINVVTCSCCHNSFQICRCDSLFIDHSDHVTDTSEDEDEDGSD